MVHAPAGGAPRKPRLRDAQPVLLTIALIRAHCCFRAHLNFARRCSYRHVVLSQVQRSWAQVVFAAATGCTTPNATFNRASSSAEPFAAPGPTADDSSNSYDP